jgi:hypothetical protein
MKQHPSTRHPRLPCASREMMVLTQVLTRAVPERAGSTRIGLANDGFPRWHWRWAEQENNAELVSRRQSVYPPDNRDRGCGVLLERDILARNQCRILGTRGYARRIQGEFGFPGADAPFSFPMALAVLCHPANFASQRRGLGGCGHRACMAVICHSAGATPCWQANTAGSGSARFGSGTYWERSGKTSRRLAPDQREHSSSGGTRANLAHPGSANRFGTKAGGVTRES